MNFATLIAAIILGIIQGITELLPVSSSAHLLLIPPFIQKLMPWLDFSFQDTRFDIVLHVATFLAISIYYRKTIGAILTKFLSDFRSKDNEISTITIKVLNINIPRTAVTLALTSLPTLALGAVIYIVGDDLVKSNSLATFNLLFVGLILIYIEFTSRNNPENLTSTNSISEANIQLIEKISFKSAFIIGLFQTLSLLRGVSRLGITMIGGITQKLSRREALDYAFIASLPIFAILTVVEILDLVKEKAASKTGPFELILGFITAFTVAIIVLRVFRQIINKNGALAAFGIYRILLALIIIISSIFF